MNWKNSTLLLLMLSLGLFSSCNIDCSDSHNLTTYEYVVSEEALQWFPDSACRSFKMKSNTGITEAFDAGQASIDNINKNYGRYDGMGNGRGCKCLQFHYSALSWNSTYQHPCYMRISGGTEGSGFEFNFDDVYIGYNFNKKAGTRIQSPKGTLGSSAQLSDSLQVAGKTYYKILAFTLNEISRTLAETEPKELYFSQKIGLIKYIQKDGTIWERQP